MDIKNLKGIGPKISEKLKSIGIVTTYDAMTYFPRDYEDRSNEKPVYDMQDGEYAALTCQVEMIYTARRTFSKKTINKILFKNESGYIVGIWFNQPYIQNNFKVGEQVFLYGKISKKTGEIQIVEPQYEKDVNNIRPGINPIYPANKLVTQKILRNVIKQSLNYIDSEVNEFLPSSFRKIYELPDIKTALINIHFPSDNNMLNLSVMRLKFDELLILQLCLFLLKQEFRKSKTSNLILIDKSIGKIKEMIGFNLTNAQSRTVREILSDMKKEVPMNRLIQGDVGSGKTIIATIALINCALNGCQGAIMAPTEILAEQHFTTISSLASKFNLNTVLITGSTPQKDKKEILRKISCGEANLVVGTHSLIQDNVEFKNLALVITDEQHRFGVRQRGELINKGINPHVLVMTATPIPRTLALFIYGDMDISIIDELPPGRKKIDTYFIGPEKRQSMYNFVKNEVNKGRQAYVVCPLIEESEKLNVESAVETYIYVKENYFNNVPIGLLHGKMSPKEKEEVMLKFKNNEISVLISTTVIEVGVNVPNATIMVIENSDRFGLAQLHQLRGRVGRGEHKSYCILISQVKNKEFKERMKIMTETNDGFKIADKDLEIRGSGEFFGVRQHGLPELKMADVVKDIELVKKTRDIAKELIEMDTINSDDYKMLKKEVEKFILQNIRDITFN